MMKVFTNVLCGLLITLACASTARAGMQHLVAPGESWESLAAKVQPGDEIILMPGRHKSAIIEKLVGTKDQPITIRGIDPEHPSIIQAARHGILIVDPKFVIIENIEVTGASIAGIALRSLPDASTQPQQSAHGLHEAYVQLRHVKITKIGPTGRRDALEIVGQDRVSVEDCSFEGWGGAAITVIASANVTIDNCTFKALPDHSQSEAILIRSGSQQVNIEHCTFELNDRPALFAGGRSDLAAFQPAVADDARPGTVFEARQIQMNHCIIRNAQVPIMMQSADSVVVRSCTFIRPRGSLVMFDHKHEDPRLAVAARFIFGDNLITWEAGDLVTCAVVPPSVDLRGISWEQNLWWSNEPLEDRLKLGELQGDTSFDQIMDLDPQLDDELRPLAEDAKMFGAVTPE